MAERYVARGRGDVGWGDALRAAGSLGLTTPEELDWLVEFLHLRASAEPEPEATYDDEETQGATSQRGRSDVWIEPAQVGDEEESVPRATVVEPLDALPVDFTPELGEPLETVAASNPVVAYEPPVDAVLLRSALVLLVQRTRESAEVDLDAAAAAIAEQRPMSSLPTRTEPTTHRGVTVLADVGGSMLPYRGDRERFVAELVDSVGGPNVEVHLVPDTRSAALAELLVPGRPTLLISTLGAVEAPASPPSARWRWVELAEAAADQSADVVALVPHRLKAWPSAIAEAFKLVAWDDLDLVGRGRG